MLGPNGTNCARLADLSSAINWAVDSRECLLIIQPNVYRIQLHSLGGRYVKMLVKNVKDEMYGLSYDSCSKRLYFLQGFESTWQLMTTEIDNPGPAAIADFNEPIVASDYHISRSNIRFVWCTWKKVVKMYRMYRYDVYYVMYNHPPPVIPQMLTNISSPCKLLQLVVLNDVIIYSRQDMSVRMLNFTSNLETILTQSFENGDNSLSVTTFGDEIAIVSILDDDSDGHLYIYNLDGTKILETVTKPFEELKSG